MKYDVIALLLFCVAGFGGLGYLFVSLTDGINQPVSERPARIMTVPDAGAPPAGPIVDESAPVVLGGPSITTTEARDVLMVNFNACEPGSGALELDAVSISFELTGPDGNDCQASYSSGEQGVSCSVPRSLGLQRFPIANGALNAAPIERYCD